MTFKWTESTFDFDGGLADDEVDFDFRVERSGNSAELKFLRDKKGEVHDAVTMRLRMEWLDGIIEKLEAYRAQLREADRPGSLAEPEKPFQERVYKYKLMYWSTRQEGDIRKPYGEGDYDYTHLPSGHPMDNTDMSKAYQSLYDDPTIYRLEIWQFFAGFERKVYDALKL